MAEILIDEGVLVTCKGKVVVVTGAANGIGAATVKRFFHSGAHVFFSDWDEKSGSALEKTLQSTSRPGDGTCNFTRVDVRDYQAQLSQFDTAYKEHGRVDMAVYSAGINEKAAIGSIVAAENNLETVKEKYPKPIMDLLDINLNGCIYFARIALAYLHEGSDSSQPPSKGITFISSAAAFQEAPGMPGYASSKVGILGLMRSVRSLAPNICNTRVNVIAPWATDTAMVEGHTHLFTDNNIPLQSPDDVAVFTQLVTADPRVNGKTVYVGASRGFDIEEGLQRTLPQWLGQVNASLWEQQAEAFAKGDWLKSSENGNGNGNSIH